ncbi:hypothetical protein O9992_18080 [Vibrio lentus]|nr:hypothetical protein [Vibrio lentus]
MKSLIDESLFGLGPLQPFGRRPVYFDIMVNGPNNIFFERQWQGEKVRKSRLWNEEQLLAIAKRIASRV